MIVVLDANVLWPHVSLTGPNWGDLQAAAKERRLSVLIPRHVVEEVKGRDARRLGEQVALLRRGHRFFSRAVKDHVLAAIHTATVEHDEWTASYEDFLAAWGAEVLPTPPHDHDIIAGRAARRTRPFNENGMGYRDTLLWLTVLDVAKAADEDDEVVLVSSDASAFGGAKGLHSDLVGELASLGIDTPVSWVPKITDLSLPGQYRGEAVPFSSLAGIVSEEDVLGYVEALITDSSVDFLDVDALQTAADDAWIEELFSARSRDLVAQELTATREIVVTFDLEYDAVLALELLDESEDDPVVRHGSEFMRLNVFGSLLLTPGASRISELRELDIRRVKPAYTLGASRRKIKVSVPPNLNQNVASVLADVQRHFTLQAPPRENRLDHNEGDVSP